MAWKTAPFALVFCLLASTLSAHPFDLEPDRVRVACLRPVVLPVAHPASVFQNNRPLDSLGIPDCRLMDRILALDLTLVLTPSTQPESTDPEAPASVQPLAHPALQASHWMAGQTAPALSDPATIARKLAAFQQTVALTWKSAYQSWDLAVVPFDSLQASFRPWPIATGIAQWSTRSPAISTETGPSRGVSPATKCWLISSSSTISEPDSEASRSEADEYWEYYEDCDYWNVTFASAENVVATKLPHHLSVSGNSILAGFETRGSEAIRGMEYHYGWMKRQLTERQGAWVDNREAIRQSLEAQWSDLEFRWIELGWQANLITGEIEIPVEFLRW